MRSVTFDAAAGEIEAVAGDDLATTLMRAFGYETMKVGVRSKVARGSSSVEIALVLDNSGSMGASSGTEAGTYIGDLKVAARNLGVVYAGAEGTDKVKMSVVPFASSVNVGPRIAAVVDRWRCGLVHPHRELRGGAPPFRPLRRARRGLARMRRGAARSFDVQDAPATGGDTRFVPMFAVDEPGDAGANDLGYANSYLNDDGGSCPPYRASAPVVIRAEARAAAGRSRACPTPKRRPAPANTRRDRIRGDRAQCRMPGPGDPAARCAQGDAQRHRRHGGERQHQHQRGPHVGLANALAGGAVQRGSALRDPANSKYVC